MDDVVGIAFAALFAVSIFILAGMFWQALSTPESF
jgi:hypothetical protein